MITVKSGNYTQQEKAIISSTCRAAIDYICSKCEHTYDQFVCHNSCPYKHVIYDLNLVDKKYPTMRQQEMTKSNIL